MADAMYHPITPEIAARRKELAPDTHAAFEAFSRAVFDEGALPEKTKQLIAVAVAHTTSSANSALARRCHHDRVSCGAADG